jgi:hypothetical protein
VFVCVHIRLFIIGGGGVGRGVIITFFVKKRWGGWERAEEHEGWTASSSFPTCLENPTLYVKRNVQGGVGLFTFAWKTNNFSPVSEES